MGIGATRLSATVAGLGLLVAAAGGCGGSGATAPTTAPTTASSPTTTTTTGGPGALQAEAQAAATGDIPDNQMFLVFANHRGHYAMKYPEGWAQQGAGDSVSFRDKNNVVRVVVTAGPAPTKASVSADVAHLAAAHVQSAPQAMTISGRPAFKTVYTTVSAPNPVTGKRVKLVVDRYYVWKGGRRAVVDLGTPVGVDNVDAYRLMIESFRWS
jgi:hypothetical protein